MSRDLGPLIKRVNKLSDGVGCASAGTKPVALFWGEEPAPGFEDMAEELLDEETGEPKNEVRKKNH